MASASPAAVLKLAAVLDAAAAATLRASLLELRGHDLCLDAAAVERAGTLCLQVLLAAAASWKADGLVLWVASASRIFGEATGILGIGSHQLRTEPSAP